MQNDRAKLLTALRNGTEVECPGCRERLGSLQCGHCGYAFDFDSRRTRQQTNGFGVADPAIARVTRLAWIIRHWLGRQKRFTSAAFLERFPDISPKSLRRDLFTLTQAGFKYKVEDKTPRLPTAYVFAGFSDEKASTRRRLHAVS